MILLAFSGANLGVLACSLDGTQTEASATEFKAYISLNDFTGYSAAVLLVKARKPKSGSTWFKTTDIYGLERVRVGEF
jgi:hypothetical protein